MEENKTLLVKEGSLGEFRKNIVSNELTKIFADFNIRIGDVNQKKYDWLIKEKEFIVKRGLVKDNEFVTIELSDKAELTDIELVSRFIYKVEPYDDLSVKLVLESTNSERA